MYSLRKVVLFSVFMIFAGLYVTPLSAADTKAAPVAAAPAPELWSKRCQDLKDSKDAKKITGHYCEVFQRLAYQLKDGKTMQRVTELAVGYPPGEKTARAVIILPLGVMVQDTMSIFIDEKDENHFHVQYCLADGCYATLNLPDALLQKIGKGKKLMLAGKFMNGQGLHIIIELTGFAKAVAQIKP